MAFSFPNFITSWFRPTNNRRQVSDLAQPANVAPTVMVNAPGHRRLMAGALLKAPVLCLAATVVSAGFCVFGHQAWELAGLSGLVVWPALAVMHFELSGATWAAWCAPVRKVVGGTPVASLARLSSIQDGAKQIPAQDHNVE
jgi:hypothetical protein